jgi:hypothetical protein
VTYVGDKASGFANLARIDPALLCAKKPTPTYKNPYVCFRGSSAPAKCLMVGFVNEDKTTEPFTVPKNGKIMKSFSLIPLSLEAERNFAVICVLFGVETYTSDILGNILTLTTRSEVPLGKRLLSNIYPCTYYVF